MAYKRTPCALLFHGLRKSAAKIHDQNAKIKWLDLANPAVGVSEGFPIF